MHELAISSAIVETAVRHADGRRVYAVRVRVGALRQVLGESLTFYYDVVACDTLCEGSSLELEPVRAWLRCPVCTHEWDPDPRPLVDHGPGAPTESPVFRCPGCGLAGGEAVRGGELEIESIEVEDAASAAPTAN